MALVDNVRPLYSAVTALIVAVMVAPLPYRTVQRQKYTIEDCAGYINSISCHDVKMRDQMDGII
jgi:hypothetical protein